MLLGQPTIVRLTPARGKGLERVADEADFVVHRPGLSLNEVLVLAWCPYEVNTPRFSIPDELRRYVNRLVREDLLESYSDGAGVRRHRCTALGIDVVQAYAKGGFLGDHAKKHYLKLGQSWRYRRVYEEPSVALKLAYGDAVEVLVFERAED